MALIIAGLISNPQLRHTADGKQVCDFLFVFNQRLGQATTSRQIVASAWNLTAESIMQSFPEGGYVILEANYRDDVVEREGGVREHYHNLSVMRVHPGSEGLELNAISLVGAAELDSETLTFESGTIKSSNRLGIRRTQEITDWISIEGWGKTATTMAKYVVKGKQVAIDGSLKIDSWTDKTTGQERFKPIVLVDRLTLLGGSNRAGQLEDTPGGDAAVATASTGVTRNKSAKAAAKNSVIPF
jgi:single-strand DNA-binding protein